MLMRSLIRSVLSARTREVTNCSRRLVTAAAQSRCARQSGPYTSVSHAGPRLTPLATFGSRRRSLCVASADGKEEKPTKLKMKIDKNAEISIETGAPEPTEGMLLEQEIDLRDLADSSLEGDDVFDDEDDDEELDDEDSVFFDEDLDDEDSVFFDEDLVNKDFMQNTELEDFDSDSDEEEDFDDDDDEGEESMLAEDYDPTFKTGGVPWGESALAAARKVLAADVFGGNLQMYSFRVDPVGGHITVRLDKLTDPYGSPSLEDLQAFSEAFGPALDVEGVSPDELSVEVSTAGAEREVRIPRDCGRFVSLPMTVVYGAEGSQPTKEVLELLEWDEAGQTVTWRLADVAANKAGTKKGQGLNKKQRERREVTPFASLRRVTLYIDV